MKMKFAVVILVFSFVGCIESDPDDTLGHGSFHGGPGATGPKECPPGIYLHTWGVYLIGFSMLLMFLAIIYLIYALLKAKGHQYNVMTDMSQTTYGTANRPIIKRQESEIPICNANSTAITPVEEIVVDNLFFNNSDGLSFSKSQTCNNNGPAVLERNGASTSTINKYESKVLPIIKKSVQSHLMLPPEQMREICKGVLQNRKSNKDLNELVESFERRGSKVSKKGLAREKSASTPELDLIYDVLPSPTLSSESNNNSDVDNEITNNKNKESVTEDIENKNSKELEATNNADEHLDDIYDSPPVTSSTKKIVYKETEYLIVIDPALDTPSDKGPSYINAKTNEYIL